MKFFKQRESLANMSESLSIKAAIGFGQSTDGELKPFESLAYTGAPMKLEGWKYPTIIDLAGFSAPRQNMPVLRDHEFSRIVGHTTDISVGSDGVRIRGVISGTGPDAQEVLASAKNGFPWQASLGSKPVMKTVVEHLAVGKTTIVNGREVEGPMSIVRRATMHELSFTPLGADMDTFAAIAASQGGLQPMDEFDTWLQSLGVDPATLSAEAKPALQAAFEQSQKNVTASGTSTLDIKGIVEAAVKASADANKPATTPDIETIVASAVEKASKATADSIRATHEAQFKASVDAAVTKAAKDTADAIAASHANELRLERVCNGRPEILSKAKAENWTIDKAELEVLRASRPRPMFASTGEDGSPDGAEVIEAALCLNAGIEGEELKDQYDEKVIDAATSRKYRGFGLHALMHGVIQASGRSYSPGIVNNDFIRTAFEADQAIRASGMSNYSLSGTLSNVANKAVVAGFNTVEDTWSRVGSVGSVKDFKQKSAYRLGGDFEYKKVGPSGELKHATMSEDSYTNQADTYGRIFGVSRKDLINDDLSAIESTARIKLGRGAGLAINKAFWTAFMDNSTFFTDARGNYFEGAATNLQVSSLTTAETKFYNMTDENGDPVSLTPTILLVPNALNVLGTQLMRDTEVRDTTASTKYTTGNPHAGKFRVERSSHLSNTNYTGYSTTAWYLLCDPAEAGVGVIEIVFLNGQRMPTIETSELDFDQLGIWMRGFHDFGVNKQEYRCGVMSKGAA